MNQANVIKRQLARFLEKQLGEYPLSPEWKMQTDMLTPTQIDIRMVGPTGPPIYFLIKVSEQQ